VHLNDDFNEVRNQAGGRGRLVERRAVRTFPVPAFESPRSQAQCRASL
jgi:hypothetical protein